MSAVARDGERIARKHLPYEAWVEKTSTELRRAHLAADINAAIDKAVKAVEVSDDADYWMQRHCALERELELAERRALAVDEPMQQPAGAICPFTGDADDGPGEQR